MLGGRGSYPINGFKDFPTYSVQRCVQTVVEFSYLVRSGTTEIRFLSHYVYWIVN
jgi:hypothetical protein